MILETNVLHRIHRGDIYVFVRIISRLLGIENGRETVLGYREGVMKGWDRGGVGGLHSILKTVIDPDLSYKTLEREQGVRHYFFYRMGGTYPGATRIYILRRIGLSKVTFKLCL